MFKILTINTTRSLIAFFLLLSTMPLTSANETSRNWQSEMLAKVNKIRIDNGVPSLRICKSLGLAAQRYSEYMAKENFLSHTGKDGSSLGDRLIKAGFRWKNSNSYIGENIAAGQQSVREVLSGWLNSPPHYRNIVNKNFTHVGFGKATSTSSKYGVYWVQNFGSGVKC